jgi:hypothetical protein
MLSLILNYITAINIRLTSQSQLALIGLFSTPSQILSLSPSSGLNIHCQIKTQ